MTATTLDLSAIRTDATVYAATFRTLIGVDISSFATAAQGTLADSALQPSDITSGTITAGTGDIDFDDLGGGGGGPENVADITGGALVNTGNGTTPGIARAETLEALSTGVTGSQQLKLSYGPDNTYNNSFTSFFSGTQASQSLSIVMSGPWGSGTPLKLYGNGRVEFATGVTTYIPDLVAGSTNYSNGSEYTINAAGVDAVHLAMGYIGSGYRNQIRNKFSSSQDTLNQMVFEVVDKLGTTISTVLTLKGDLASEFAGNIQAAAATFSGVLSKGAYTVATLPTAATNAGKEAQVTDSTVAASGNYGATVAGTGANRVKVFSNGTNWVIA